MDPAVNYGCKCAAEGNTAIADCQICEHRAGEYGQHCLKCNAGMVSRFGSTHDRCSMPPPGSIYHGSSLSALELALACNCGHVKR